MAFDSPLFRVLDFVADSFNVAITLLALAAPALRSAWRSWGAALRYFAATLAGLGVVYGVQALDQRFGLWPAWGLDYSTHMAYAVALATSVACWDRRWARALAAAVCGYALLIFVLGYHGPADVLTAAAVAGPATWLLHRFATMRKEKR